MKGSVTRLFDIDQIVFPDDMFEVSVDERVIDEKVDMLSLRYAVETEVNTVSEGDIVYCSADRQSYPDGRKIILYTDVCLPDAEEASREVIGKTVGDIFEARLCEANVSLTVQKILHRTRAAVNDALIASMGIENVHTVSDYREYLREAEIAEQQSEQSKLAIQYALQVLVDNSEFSYDEAEMDAYTQELIDQQTSEMEESEFEMDMDELRQLAALQIKQGWAAKAYCESHGIEIDLSAIDAEIDTIIEMQTLMGEEAISREAYVAMFVENQYLSKLFEALNLRIQSVMEG